MHMKNVETVFEVEIVFVGSVVVELETLETVVLELEMLETVVGIVEISEGQILGKIVLNSIQLITQIK
jgi:hypothetical protein